MATAAVTLIFAGATVFGFFFTYQYAAIARSYALGALLLFSLARVDSSRLQRPLRYGIFIALLANTTVVYLFFAGAFLLCWGRELRKPAIAKRCRWGFLIAMLGCLASVLQLWPAADGALGGFGKAFMKDSLTQRLAEALVAPRSFPFQTALLVVLIFYPLLLLSLVAKPRCLLLLQTMLIGFIFVHGFNYDGAYWHAGVLLTGVIACLWLNAEAEAPFSPFRPPAVLRRHATFFGAVRVSVNSLLVLSWLSALPPSWRLYHDEITKEYSGAKEMSRLMKERGWDNLPILALSPWRSEALLPYLPGRSFLFAGVNRRGTYCLWNSEERTADFETAERKMTEAELQFPGWRLDGLSLLILVVGEALSQPSNHGVRLLLENTSRPFFLNGRETYYLYAPLDTPEQASSVVYGGK